MIRFGLVGIVNTVVGFATIVLFMEGLGWSPWVANALGYAVGLVLGFVLNKTITFDRAGGGRAMFYKYVFAFAAAYALNLFVLGIALNELGDMRLVAQLLAMIAYTMSFFLACKYYVFR